MILTIHQPEHLPWLGYYNKISTADVFVVLDNVQFRKNYFQNRNKVKGSNGVQWIGVPVETKGHMDSNICDIKIANAANPKWREKYIKTIEYGYSKHPFYSEYFPFFRKLISEEHVNLCEMNMKIIHYFAELLNLHPKFIMASELDVDGAKTDLILDICTRLNATTYVAGPSGRDYLNIDSFSEVGIKVVYNDFKHPEYEQYKEKEFIPYMAVLDLFMNVDVERAKEIVCGSNFWSDS